MYHVLRGPLMQADGNLRAVPHYDDRGKLDWADGIRKPYREVIAPETAAAPANWKAADFEDGDWLRGTAVRAIRSPYLERLCLRGKFTVTDPAKVKGLTISVDYHGGAVVYVNGQEIAREHLAAGAAMAEEYPLEAFVAPNGKLIGVRGDEALQRTKIPPDVLKRIQGRVRKLSAAVPAKAIQAGLNVVAVELVRAPYHKVVDEQMAILDNHNRSKIEDLSWNTCEIKRVQLTAAGADGLVPGASRTAGFELWNSNPLAIDYDLDQGEAGPLYPIRLAAAQRRIFRQGGSRQRQADSRPGRNGRRPQGRKWEHPRRRCSGPLRPARGQRHHHQPGVQRDSAVPRHPLAVPGTL